MARIKPFTKAHSPSNGSGVETSNRSLPCISQQLHREIEREIIRQLARGISKINRRNILEAIKRRPVVATVRKIEFEVIILRVAGRLVTIRMVVPLGGDPDQVHEVIAALLRNLRLGSCGLYAEGRCIGAEIVLPCAAIEIDTVLPNSSNYTKKIWVTAEQALLLGTSTAASAA